MPTLRLICIAVWLSVIVTQGSPRRAPTPGCSYADCAFRGVKPRSVGIEKYLILLNILEIPDDAAEQCSVVLRNISACQAENIGCPKSLKKPWSRRLHDDYYVNFLSSVASRVCLIPEKTVALRNCLTRKLQQRLKKCIGKAPNFNFICMTEAYNAGNNCSEDIDDFFGLLIKLLSANPYAPRN